jgi:transcription initiation factor TFIIIB Brf1 subunit/transcription initiation factor TFIIB
MTIEQHESQTDSHHETTENKTGSCPKCGSEQVDEGFPDIDRVCAKCGLVFSDDIERSNPSYNEGPPQTESSPSPDNASTQWGETYSVTNSTEQSVAEALSHLEMLGDSLGLGEQLRKRAASLYAKAATRNLVDGRKREAVIAGAVLISAREDGTPYPISKIAEAADVCESRAGEIVRILHDELKISASECGIDSYVSYLCSELSLNKEIQLQARSIVQNIPAEETAGKHPFGVAGAAVYIATDFDVTQRQIAQAAGITTETIRMRLKEMRDSEHD